jgi:hypothetical protein
VTPALHGASLIQGLACRFMAKLILEALTAQASGTPVPLRRPLRAVIPVRFEEGLNGGVAEPR